MNELALFAGAGGEILGSTLLGWRTVCAVEIEPYAASVLVQRQNDGILPTFPIWDDVCTFDGRPWRGIADVISGGFPCQDISVAGKGEGITGSRSGLWKEFSRIIGEVRPRYVLVENSPVLTSRGFGTVLGDLAEMGYDADWGVLGAIDAGAPHKRERIWIVAYPRSEQHKGAGDEIGRQTTARFSQADMADATEYGRGQGRTGRLDPGGTRESEQALCYSDIEGLAEREGEPGDDGAEQPAAIGAGWWSTEPDVDRVAHGLAARVDRLKAIGNGQVPAVVALAWETLT